jgi:nitrate/nitrite transporter NarK
MDSGMRTGSEATAFCFFLLCYLIGWVLTWWMYVRHSSVVRHTVMPGQAAAALSELRPRRIEALDRDGVVVPGDH